MRSARAGARWKPNSLTRAIAAAHHSPAPSTTAAHSAAVRNSAPSPDPMNWGRIAAKKSSAFGLVAFVTNPRT